VPDKILGLIAMKVELQNSSQNDLPDKRVSRGLSKRVVCPTCNKYGTLVAKQRGRQYYFYVQHRVKEGDRWKVVEHYVGPARLFYVGSKLLKKPLVRINCTVEPMEPADSGEIISSEPFITFTSTFLEKEEKDINTLRQTAIDYASLLLWLREIVDRSIENLKKGFGITDEEITNRLKELKEEFVIMRFYRKP